MSTATDSCRTRSAGKSSFCAWLSACMDRGKAREEGRSLDERAKLPTPQILGIDEFALRKGHRYDTILCDLEDRDVLEVCEGRKKEEVVKLLERLSDPDAVRAVSMDMSASFRPAVAAALPNAQIVVDHFHVIQHVMKAFRKVLSSWAHRKEGMILLHRKQYLFLIAKDDLTEQEACERERIGTRLPILLQSMAIERSIAHMVRHSNGC